jgi:organic radical activating enzyme
MQQIKVSEKFFSLQGEGRFVGVPSVFLRTFGCNFTCSGFGMPKGQLSTEADEVAAKVSLFKTLDDVPLVSTGCDSFISWHPAFKNMSTTYKTSDLAEKLVELLPNRRWRQANENDIHLVITGGEPLLGWQRAYPELINDDRMIGLKNITFETNGTQPLTEQFRIFLDEWQAVAGREVTFSVSPKLSSSGEKWEDAIRPDIVANYERFGHTYLKFVVSTPEDFDEVRKAVSSYRAANFRGAVYVMPVGGVESVYHMNEAKVAKMAMAEGWYFSPRLHINLFGNAWAT